MLNTHYNSALYLEASHLQAKVETNEEKALRIPRASSCLVFLGLSQPPGTCLGSGCVCNPHSHSN